MVMAFLILRDLAIICQESLDEVILPLRCNQHFDHSAACTAPLSGTDCFWGDTPISCPGTFHGRISFIHSSFFIFYSGIRTWYYTSNVRLLIPLGYLCGIEHLAGQNFASGGNYFSYKISHVCISGRWFCVCITFEHSYKAQSSSHNAGPQKVLLFENFYDI